MIRRCQLACEAVLLPNREYASIAYHLLSFQGMTVNELRRVKVVMATDVAPLLYRMICTDVMTSRECNLVPFNR
jgi:hypothetical protein